eukprot:UN1011
MARRWRYAFLLGDAGALLHGDPDGHWATSYGNPCGNLWNFQFEIEVFTCLAFLLALPQLLADAALVAVLAHGCRALSRGGDLWLHHHARGVALMVLFLRALGRLGVARLPAAWQAARLPGLLFIGLAAAVHGILDGHWLSKAMPDVAACVTSHQELSTVAYQAALAVGMALLCKACHATTEPPGARLCAASRLSFGMNLAHLFVQFLIEAHVSVDVRVFSVFSWFTQLLGIYTLSAAAASVAFVLVQRPWATVLGAVVNGVPK